MGGFPTPVQFLYSIIGMFVRVNSAARLRSFCCGLLKQPITMDVIMDGFNQGPAVFILHFLPV